MGSGCARFGFDRLDPDRGGAIPSLPVLTGAGAGGIGAGGESSGSSGNGAGGSGASTGGNAGGGSGSDVDGGQPVLADSGSPEPDAGNADGCFAPAPNDGSSGGDCGGRRCGPCACSFDVPERLGDPNYAGNDLWSPRLSSDGLSLYFGVTIPGLAEQVAVARRTDKSSPFGLGEPLPAAINQGKEGTPFPSADGSSLYFYSERTGGAGSRDLYVATRTGESAPFDDVTALTALNGSALDYLPWLSPDELTIYFVSGSAGSGDLYRSTRGSRVASFAAPTAISELNTASDEGGITLSFDGREAIFASNRPGGSGGRDLYLAVRPSLGEPFSTPQAIDELNTVDNELDPAFSPDGHALYFASNRGGGDSAIYRVQRRCTR